MQFIGMIDVDSHNFPNLALMKLSASHNETNDTVEWYDEKHEYDIVYMAKVFDDTYTKDFPKEITNANLIVKGGTGYSLEGILPHCTEHIMPDYGLYGITDTAYGFLTRGCPRNCEFCIVGQKEGLKSCKVADITEFWNGQAKIEIMDPNILACKDRLGLLDQVIDTKAMVNFNQGLDIRFTDDDVIDRLGKIRMKRVHFAWDNPNDDLEPYFKNFTKKYKRKSVASKVVYVLVNFNSTMEENLYRIYKLRELGYDPYVMIYDKPNAPQEIKDLQRWVNNRFIWRKCEKFEDYKRR